jgi:hypothetical protein
MHIQRTSVGIMSWAYGSLSPRERAGGEGLWGLGHTTRSLVRHYGVSSNSSIRARARATASCACKRLAIRAAFSW